MASPASLADGCAWIDGEYQPVREARIPLLETGFVRSDATYDVVAVWQGRFFRLDDHLDRLQRSCELIRLAPPLPRSQIKEILHELVARSGLREAYVEAIVTRGVPRGGERDPRRFEPRFYAFAVPYIWIACPDVADVGTDVVIARDTHRIAESSIDPRVKNFQWGDFVRALFESYDRDAWLPLLTDTDGLITEGPGFNVFAAVDRTLRTPARGIFEGITRRTVLELAATEGIAVEVGDLRVGELDAAAEVFLTSTAGGVMPVATIDGQPVGDGTPGPLTRRLRDLYWEAHSDPRLTEAVDFPLARGVVRSPAV
jgi:branched-chain amino acid aminotransferase